jgi:large subunit ribosomal protein L10
MPTAQKAEVIEKTKERLDKAVGVVFTEYRGINVSQMQNLRSQIKEKGGEMQVVKNTLLVRAAGDASENFPEEFKSGPTAVAFLYENESDCAKALFDFRKANKSFVIKGGLFDGQILDEKEVEAFSKLPSKDVLIAQVIGTIAAPLTALAGTIEAIYADPIRTVGAVADKASDGGEAASA